MVQLVHCKFASSYTPGLDPPSKFFDPLLIIACYRLSTLAAYGQPPSYFLAIPTLICTLRFVNNSEQAIEHDTLKNIQLVKTLVNY